MKRVLLSALLLLLGVAAQAQVQPIPFVKPQWFDVNGKPASGGCLFTYATGTSTPIASYSDYLGSVLNSNPVILDSAGRASVFLSGTAYRLVLRTAGGVNCVSGAQQWTMDGINPSANSILSSNNVWTGSNAWNAASTFNSSATFATGLTANGPVNMTSGGAMAGTYSNSPTFSGTPNFAGGFLATTGTFSGQIVSTLVGPVAPLAVGSTVMVANLNSNFLENGTWEFPGNIGSTTPNNGRFQALTALTSFALASGQVLTVTQGTDTALPTAGAFTGSAGATVCKSGNAGITTVGCNVAPPISVAVTYCASGCTVTGTPCTTSGSSNTTCTNTITWPVAFSDSKYSVSCSGIAPSGVPVVRGLSKTASTVTVTTANGTNDGATASNYSEIDCQAAHN